MPCSYYIIIHYYRPVGMLDGVQLLLPLLFSLALGFSPSLLGSSPVLLPLGLPLGQLGLPFALHLPQTALPLLLCLSCLLLLCPDCFNHFAFPVPAWRCVAVAARQYEKKGIQGCSYRSGIKPWLLDFCA